MSDLRLKTGLRDSVVTSFIAALIAGGCALNDGFSANEIKESFDGIEMLATIAAAVQMESTHSCELRSDGTVECWGSNDYGQAATPDGAFSAVSMGLLHSCGLRSDGMVECWGSNDYGQAVAPGGVFSAVSAGAYHSCGLRSDGMVECWGSNDYGQAVAPGGVFSAVFRWCTSFVWFAF